MYAQFCFEKHHGGARQAKEIMLQSIIIVFKMTAYLEYLYILSVITFDHHAFFLSLITYMRRQNR
jgi:hypothetical protein